MEGSNVNLLRACQSIMLSEIVEPSIKTGNEPYQITEKYGEPWDPDNVNLMLAIYCVLFPKIRPKNMKCLRLCHEKFYECNRKGRVGETINSYNTMLGKLITENGLDSNKNLKIAMEKYKHLYHTPANCLPFPGSLNYSKGYDVTGWNYLGDFWDIKLKIIKEEWNNIIIGKSRVPLLNMNKLYFMNFNSFNDYCEYMFVNSYINYRTDDIIYLCEHDGNVKRPKNFDIYACMQYIRNASSTIYSRGNIMGQYLYSIILKYKGKLE